MRGKTNIGGGGIAINATPQQKTIKGGNIIAGDFVEYYSEPKWIEQSEWVYFRFCIGEYTVGIRNKAVVLFKNNEQISSYYGHQILDINKYNDMITFLANTGSYSIYTVGVLKIVNDQLVLVSSQETTGITSPGSSYNYAAQCAGNGKLLFLHITGNSSNNKIDKGYAFDISSEGVLSNGVKTEEIGAIWTDRLYSIDIIFCNNYFYSHSDGGSYGGGYNHKFSVGQNNIITFEVGTSEPNLQYASQELARFGSRILYNGSYNSSGNIITYDVISKNTSVLSTDDYTPGIIDGNLFVAYKRLDVGSYTYKIKIRLYRYNEQANNITLINEIVLDDEALSQTPITGINATTHYVYVQFIKQSSSSNTYNVRLFEISNGRLQDIQDQNYVIPYQEGGNPIGVAKDSGAVNDVIDVYIPVAST